MRMGICPNGLDIVWKTISRALKSPAETEGYLGRAWLWAQGKSMDEGKAQQALYDLATMIEWEMDSYYEAKRKTDLMTALAGRRMQ